MSLLLSHARPGRLPASIRERLVLFAAIAAMFAVFGVLQPDVLTRGNMGNVIVQASYLAIFAAAQSVVVMTRGFDLSLGVTVSLVSVAAAMAMKAVGGSGEVAVALGVLVGIGCSLAVSAVNGTLIARFGLNPFVVTLATLYVVLTLGTTLSGGFPVAPLPASLSAFSTGSVLGIPAPVGIAAVCLVTLQVVLSRTVFGRSITLIGTNSRAAHVAGVPVAFHLICAYLACGLLTAVGALLLTARTGSGEPNLGGDLTLQTIAASVLGGTRLRGGEGDALAPVLGALLITILSNGMNLLAIDGYLQQIFLGVVIIGALAIDRLRGE